MINRIRKLGSSVLLYVSAPLVLGSLVLGSCQKESDTLVSYDHADALVFDPAARSFAEKFKVLRDGMSQNYALWDYEKEFGMDWDEHCDTMLPKFEALDKKESVADPVLRNVMNELLTPLHDGHLTVEFTNHKTGNTITVQPSLLHNESRSDYAALTMKSYLPSLIPSRAKEGEVLEFQTASTTLDNLMFAAWNYKGAVRVWVDNEIKRIEQKTTPSEYEVRRLVSLKDLASDLSYLISYSGLEQLSKYNDIVLKYQYLEIPGLERISPSFEADGLTISYALFKGNIVYIYLDNCRLSNYLIPEDFAKMQDMQGINLKVSQQVKEVWTKWFDKIQQLHAAGTLGGVVIDVRCNKGGTFGDYQFLLGALLPAGGQTIGQLRYKRGTGRYDYSPLMPQIAPTYTMEHAVITEPIVVLTNCHSASMAETMARGAQLLPNGRVIGKRTWGGLCPVTGNENFSYNYSGQIGVQGQTPVWALVPLVATYTMDGRQEEGYGITPDIDVDLDINLYSGKKNDTQLDRALEYIRTGK